MFFKAFFKTFGFFNEVILRNTKEDTMNKGAVLTIAKANIVFAIRDKFAKMLRGSLKLKECNDTLQIPLPNRWATPNVSFAKQQLYMVIKQVMLNLTPAGLKEKMEIDKYQDRSRSSIEAMKFFKTIHLGQIQNVDIVYERFRVSLDATYLPDRELFFADTIVNGEHSYLLRKYGHQYYEMPESRKVDEDYRIAFEDAFKNQKWNDRSQKFGGNCDLSREYILERLRKSDGVYAMLFEQLQKLSGGDVIQNNPEIYVQNKRIQEIHYLHTPYPIFLRIDQPSDKGGYGYICIGIGMRIKQKVKIFSPFFADQPQQIWRLVQSHLLQAIINDFSLRVHLGVYHFTTNQYHVPIYNFLSKLPKDSSERKNFSSFLDRTYTMFSRGLQGVNVAATASLVHPIPQISLVNKVFNLSQEQVVSIIANNSNLLKIYEFNPLDIMKNQGIERSQIQKYFPKLSFDFQLYDILSSYVQDVYQLHQIQDLADGLLIQINQQTKHMGLKRQAARPGLRTNADVLKSIQNLCFCWVGFHSHTFSIMSNATYTLLRPPMLKDAIPQLQGWSSVQIGKQLPDTKIIMQFSKLNEATTQRDSDNYLIDNIRRQADNAAFYARYYQGEDYEEKKRFQKLEKRAFVTLKRLEDYEKKIIKVNDERRQRKDMTFAWMLPSTIQTSLNI